MKMKMISIICYDLETLHLSTAEYPIQLLHSFVFQLGSIAKIKGSAPIQKVLYLPCHFPYLQQTSGRQNVANSIILFTRWKKYGLRLRSSFIITCTNASKLLTHFSQRTVMYVHLCCAADNVTPLPRSCIQLTSHENWIFSQVAMLAGCVVQQVPFIPHEASMSKSSYVTDRATLSLRSQYLSPVLLRLD